MTNKLLSYSSIGVQVLTLILVAVVVFGGSSQVLGGMTNFNSLTLQPETASDDVLVVKNYSGTAQLTANGTGGITVSGTSTFTGDTRVASLVNTGASTTISTATGAATVLTAAYACDAGFVNTNASTTSASTLTLPSATTMFADCLTTNGDDTTVSIKNLSASSTVITAGASTTIAIDNGGTVTLGALGSARITFQRQTDALMWAFVSVFKP